MKRILIGLILSMVGTLAQTPSVPFATPPPPGASIIGVTYNRYTNPGAGNTFYYWIVTHYTSGDVFNPTPFEVDNVNVADPSIPHSLTISFNPIQNGITYSILRTNTSTSPTFPCTCLVGTTTGQTYILDTSIGLFAYTPSFASPAVGDLRLNNKDYNPPAFESVVNGVATKFGNGAIGNNVNGVIQVASNPATCTPGVTADIFNISTGIRYYCSGTNTWTQGSSVIGNLLDGTTLLPLATVDIRTYGVLEGSTNIYTGLSNAIFALPPTGGTIDISALHNVSLSQPITISSPVRILLPTGKLHLTGTGTIIFAMGSQGSAIIGVTAGPHLTNIVSTTLSTIQNDSQAQNAVTIKDNVDNIELGNFDILGNKLVAGATTGNNVAILNADPGGGTTANQNFYFHNVNSRVAKENSWLFSNNVFEVAAFNISGLGSGGNGLRIDKPGVTTVYPTQIHCYECIFDSNLGDSQVYNDGDLLMVGGTVADGTDCVLSTYPIATIGVHFEACSSAAFAVAGTHGVMSVSHSLFVSNSIDIDVRANATTEIGPGNTYGTYSSYVLQTAGGTGPVSVLDNIWSMTNNITDGTISNGSLLPYSNLPQWVGVSDWSQVAVTTATTSATPNQVQVFPWLNKANQMVRSIVFEITSTATGKYINLCFWDQNGKLLLDSGKQSTNTTQVFNVGNINKVLRGGPGYIGIFSDNASISYRATAVSAANLAYIDQAGIASATYTSGGSFSGTGNCTLTSFNGTGGSGATATIAVAGGVPGVIMITNSGASYTTVSTTATLGSGTATCSGTATLTSTLTSSAKIGVAANAASGNACPDPMGAITPVTTKNPPMAILQ